MTIEPHPTQQPVQHPAGRSRAQHAGQKQVQHAPPVSEYPANTLAGSPAPSPDDIAATAKQARDRLVLISMALATAAVSATLNAIFEYPVASAVLTGGLLWAGLMAVHIQHKKNAEIARLKAELSRIESQRDGANTAKVNDAPAADGMAANKPRAATQRRPTPAPQEAAGAADAQQPGRASEAAAGAVASQGALQQGSPSPGSTHQGPQPHPRWEMSPQQTAGPRNAPEVPPAATARGKHPATPQPSVETALWPGTALSAADPMRDQWAFRPKDAGMPAIPAIDADNRPMTSMPASTIEADLEMVQRKIKALADEVNAADAGRERPAMPTGMPTANSTASSALEKSIGALKATAETMRERPAPQPRRARMEHTRPESASQSARETAHEPTPQTQSLPFDLLIPATAERIAVSDPVMTVAQPPQAAPADVAATALPELPVLELPQLPVLEFASPPPRNPRLEAIIAAVENGEMDVFLSPIVALQSHQVSHYDVTVRVRAANGGYLDDAEQELQLAGSDVLALFDTARLKRAAMLAHRLDAHNKPGSLLSAVNGPSITNAEFLETFARVYEERDRISNQLVLTFTQADLEQFSASAWQALSDMHAFGFRFALSQIDHVEMDFANLAARGFAFLRLDASALLGGLPARDHFVAADELCKLLAGAGMTLVADTIDDEAVRARVFGFGVLFGQGRLFGGARQVKLDPLPSGSSAAA